MKTYYTLPLLGEGDELRQLARKELQHLLRKDIAAVRLFKGWTMSWFPRLVHHLALELGIEVEFASNAERFYEIPNHEEAPHE